MKYPLLTILLFLTTYSFATPQIPDKLQYGLNELSIDGSRILEEYYGLNHLPYYPFESTSTACYRGHIGHYKIINNRLYLSKIQIDDEDSNPTYYRPKDFNIKSSTKLGKAVFVDWFSGILICYKKDVLISP